MTDFIDGLKTVFRVILILIQMVSTLLRVNLDLCLQFQLIWLHICHGIVSKSLQLKSEQVYF
jgi:hypothetical protein